MTRDDMVQGAWSEDSIGETRADVVTGSARMKQPRTPRVRVNVQDGRVLDERRLRSGLKQLVRAVNVLHHRGLLHLDIKPSNILVGTAGRVVLLDFGLVRPLGPDQSQSNMTLGTPAYMAPEQAAGEPVGRAADWYAVGGVLYRALTGELPFVGGAADVMLAKQLDEPLHPRELVKDIPEDLANLAVELLRLDPSKRPSGREVWARIGGDLRVDFLESGATRHFVGRAREIEALRHAVGDAARGKRVVVRLSGASAIGKTTLIRHVLGACRDDIYLLEGETFERESVPFVSFDRPIDCLALVMQQLGQAGLPPEITRDLRVLSRMFPVLGTLVSDGAQDVAGIGDARRRGSRAFCNIVAWLSSQGKLPVVWIDSAQWSDRDSALLMRAMLSSDIIDRILVILSYRRGEGSSSPLLSDLERLERAQLAITWRQMDLSPLTDEAVRELARASLSEDARDEVVDAIALESAGNPLFVEAMCRYGRHLQDRTSSATRLSLHHVVAEIFEALSPTARRLLETLAVFGRPMSVDMLFPAADLADEDRVESVEALVDEQIVSTHQGERALMLSIAHDKIRELIVAWIEPEVLVALHRSIAVALTREEDYDPEHIMHHFAEGGVLDRASTYAIMAAGRALDAFAFDNAARLYERALGWMSEAPPHRQLPLRLALADALGRSQHRWRSAMEYLYAADQSEPAARAVLRVLAGEVLVSSGRLIEGFRYFEEYLDGVDFQHRRSGRVAAAQEQEDDALSEEALVALHKGTAPVDAGGLKSAQYVARGALARCLSLMLPVESGTYWRRGLVEALRMGDDALIVEALSLLSTGRCLGGDPERLTLADRHMAQVDQAVARMGRREFMVGRHLYDAVRGMVCGDMDAVKASVSLLRGADDVKNPVGHQYDSMAQALALERRWMTGSLRRLFEEARRMQRFVPRGGDRVADVLSEVYLSLSDLASNEPVKARQRVRGAEETLDEGFFTPLHYLTLRAMVWCDLYDGEHSAAYWRLEGAWPQLRGSGLMAYRPWQTEIQLTRGLLMLSAARAGTASPRRAHAYAEKALAILGEDPTPLGRGAQRVLQRALADRGVMTPDNVQEDCGESGAEIFSAGGLWFRAIGQRWSEAGREEAGEAKARRSVVEALEREGVSRPEVFLRIVNIYDATSR